MSQSDVESSVCPLFPAPTRERYLPVKILATAFFCRKKVTFSAPGSQQPSGWSDSRHGSQVRILPRSPSSPAIILTPPRFDKATPPDAHAAPVFPATATA